MFVELTIDGIKEAVNMAAAYRFAPAGGGTVIELQNTSDGFYNVKVDESYEVVLNKMRGMRWAI